MQLSETNASSLIWIWAHQSPPWRRSCCQCNVSHHPKQDYLRKGRRVRKKKERDGNFFPERKRKAKRTEEENFAVVKVLIWNTFAKFFCDKANPRCDYTCICGPSNWLLAEASDSLSSANWHWAISKWWVQLMMQHTSNLTQNRKNCKCCQFVVGFVTRTITFPSILPSGLWINMQAASSSVFFCCFDASELHVTAI